MAQAMTTRSQTARLHSIPLHLSTTLLLWTFRIDMKQLFIFFAFIIGILVGGYWTERTFGATTVVQVPQGGTGWNNLQGGSILFGNWTGKIGTSSALTYATSTNTLSVQDLLVNGICTGCGGSQTPWTSDIDGAGFNLFNVSNASTSQLSVLDAIYGGRTGTGTISFGNNGEIGIGSTTPYAALSVSSSTPILPVVAIDDTSTTQLKNDGFGILTINDRSSSQNQNAAAFSIQRTNSQLFYITPAGVVAAANGAASIPAYSFLGNRNMGMYRQTSCSCLSFSTGSNERLSLSSNGLGVLDTTNLSPLSVSGGATIGAYTASVAPSNGLIVSGNVGIGTTTPNWKLQIADTRPFLTLSDTSAGVDLKHWFFSSQGGNLYVGTTTDGYATSSISALTLNGATGVLSIGTTTDKL